MNEEYSLRIAQELEDTRIIVMRNKIKIYIDKNQAKELSSILEKQKESKFIGVGDEMINTADIVGIFTKDSVDEMSGIKKINF
jgi:hypothetical protein